PRHSWSRAELRRERVALESTGGKPREPCVESQTHDAIDVIARERLHLLSQAREPCRRIRSLEILPGRRLERDDRRGQRELARAPCKRGQHVLLSQMHAVA